MCAAVGRRAAAAALVSAAALPPAAAVAPGPEWAAVNELLRGVTMSIPAGQVGPISLHIPGIELLGLARMEADVTATVTGAAVGGLGITDIAVSHDGGADAEEVTVRVRMQAVTLNISAERLVMDIHGRITPILIPIPVPLDMQANGSMVMSMSLDMAADLRFSSGGAAIGDVPPQQLDVTSCDASNTHVHMHCEGDWPSIPVLNTPLCDLIGLVPIGGTICDIVEDPSSLLGFGLSPLLANLSRAITDAYAAPPEPTPTRETEAYLDGVPGLAELHLDTARAVFGAVYGSPGTPPHADELVVNQVLREFAPGGMAIPLNATIAIPPLGLDTLRDVEVTLASVELHLGEVTTLDVLDVTGRFSTVNTLALDHMRVDMWADVSWTTGPNTAPPGRPFRDRIHIAASMRDVRMALRLLTAVEPAKFASLPLGGFFGSGAMSFLRCLMEPTKGLGLTMLSMALGSLELDVSGEFLVPALPPGGGLNSLVAATLQAANALYGRALLRALPTLSQTWVGPLLDGLLRNAADTAAPCTPPARRRPPDPTLIDFEENFLVNMTNFFVNLVTGADPDSDTGINTIARKVGEAYGHPDGVFVWNTTSHGVWDAWIRGTPEDIDLGMMEFWTGNVTLSVGTFTALRVIQPARQCVDWAGGVCRDPVCHDRPEKARGSECFTLLSAVANNGSGSWPMSVEADVRVRWDMRGTTGGAGVLDDHVKVRVGFDAMDLDVDIVSMVDGAALGDVTVSELAVPGCLLSTFAPAGLSIVRAEGVVENAAIELDCVACSGARIRELAPRLGSPEARGNLTRLLNVVLHDAAQVLAGPRMQTLLTSTVAGAVCADPEPKERPSDGGWPAMWACVLWYIAALILALIVFSAIRYRRAVRSVAEERTNLRSTKGTRGQAGYGTTPGDDDNDEEGADNRLLEAAFRAWESLGADALCRHPCIPFSAQVGVPVALAAVVALVLSAHLARSMVSVMMEVDVGGDEMDIVVFDFTTFGVVKAVFHEPEAQRKSLAFILGFFSGALPYMKVAMLLWLWCAPTAVLPHATRLRWLEFLDYTCKWSLIDVFLSGILVSAVNVNISFPDSWASTGLWVPGLFETDVKVRIGWGCWGILLGQAVNLVTGHYMVLAQRGVMATLKLHGAIDEVPSPEGDGRASAKKRSLSRSERRASSRWTGVSLASTAWFAHGAADVMREPLRAHTFRSGCVQRLCSACVASTGHRRVRVNLLGRSLLVVALLGCVGLIVAGSTVNCCGMKTKGVITYVSDVPDYPGTPADNEWSLFDLMKIFYEQNADGKFVGVLYAALWCAVVVVVPILACCALLLMWVAPLTLIAHKQLLFLCECLVSWSVIDVFIVVSALVNIFADLLVSSVIGDKADAVDAALAAAHSAGAFDRTPAKMLVMEGWPRPGWYMLIAMGVLSNVIYLLLTGAAHAAIRDREWALDHPRGTAARRELAERWARSPSSPRPASSPHGTPSFGAGDDTPDLRRISLPDVASAEGDAARDAAPPAPPPRGCPAASDGDGSFVGLRP